MAIDVTDLPGVTQTTEIIHLTGSTEPGPAAGYLRTLLDLCLVRGMEVEWTNDNVYIVTCVKPAIFKSITMGPAGEQRLLRLLTKEPAVFREVSPQFKGGAIHVNYD